MYLGVALGPRLIISVALRHYRPAVVDALYRLLLCSIYMCVYMMSITPYIVCCYVRAVCIIIHDALAMMLLYVC